MRFRVSMYGLTVVLSSLVLVGCSDPNGPEVTVLRGTITQRWLGPAANLGLGSTTDSTVTTIQFETPQFSCPVAQFALTPDTRVDGAESRAARNDALSIGTTVTVWGVHPSPPLGLCPLQWRAARIIVDK